MQGIMFAPQKGGSFTITNAVASAAGVAITPNANKIALTNTSTTAIAYFRVTPGPTTSAEAATTTADMPVLPTQQIQVFVGHGEKAIRAIASAADGNLIVTPGNAV